VTLHETLLAYSRKEATKDHVLRALCEHGDWVAPAVFAHLATKLNTFERVSIYGTESRVAANKLYLFSDRGAAEAAAAKVQLGPYVMPVHGARLFAALPADFNELHVNPASPQEQCWFMGGEALALGALWGQAVDLERVMTGKSQGDLLELLFSFRGFTTFSTQTGAIATAVGAAGLKNPAMVFTAPDCADKVLASLGEQGKTLKRVVSSGEQLFSAFPRLGVDGLVFNPMGPGPGKVLNEELCMQIVAALADRAELRRLEELAKE
jgi:hypothetical protein